MRKLVMAVILPLAAAAVLGSVALAPVASAAPAKNVTIYPKGTDTKVIKDDMKRMSKALGVQCDYCHDMAALDKDSDMKKKAREMMKLTASINAQLKAAKFTQPTSCNTCHLGQKKPKPDAK